MSEWEIIEEQAVEQQRAIARNELDSDQGRLMAQGQSVSTMSTQFATAIRVQHPRDLKECKRRLREEATLAEESFFYGWGAGDNRVVGPSIGLAMAAARIWGNCVIEPQPVQETAHAWIFGVSFVDLETGFTVGRQFRQDKGWTVHGRFDEMRKEDIRFQIGQSKAARNVILNALPKWLITEGMRAAQAGVRDSVSRFVAAKGIATAQDMIIRGLAKHGVSVEAILDKLGIANRKAMDVEAIVQLRGDLYALDEGHERAETLYPAMGGNGGKGPAVSQLNSQLEGDAPPAGEDAQFTRQEAEEMARKEAAEGKAAVEPEKPKRRRGRPKLTEEEKAARAKKQAATLSPEKAELVQPEVDPPEVDPPEVDPATGEQIPDDLPMTGGDGQLIETEAEEAEFKPDKDGPGDDGYPEGFQAALAACKSVGQVEKLLEEAMAVPEHSSMRDLCEAAASQRADEIRAMYRKL